jgi:cbb3-type cytochrome oxidase cytochrome c subunit
VGAESSGFGGGAEQDSEMKDETTDDIANRASTSSDGMEEERDSEIEDEIADEIARVDALSAYDINLDKEIEAINEYLAMLDASQESC